MKKVLEAMVHLINMGNPVHIVWAAVIFLSTIILIVLHRILKNDTKQIRIWRCLCAIPLISCVIHFAIFGMGPAWLYLLRYYLFLYIPSIIIALWGVFGIWKYGYYILAVLSSATSFLLGIYFSTGSPYVANYTRLGWAEAFSKTCDYLEENYILKDWKELDFEQIKKELLTVVEKAEKENDFESYYKAVEQLVYKLHDGHAWIELYEADAQSVGLYRGLCNDYGFCMVTLDDGQTIAVNVEDGCEAMEKGITEGCIITKWNGIPIEEAEVDMANSNIPVANNEELLKPIILSGMGGETVTVSYIDENGKETEITVKAIEYDKVEGIEAVFTYTARKDETIGELVHLNDWNSNYETKMLTDDCGYIMLTENATSGFQDIKGYLTGNHEYAREMFREKLRALEAQGMTKLVIDLRGNGGGFDEIGCALVDLLATEDFLSQSFGIIKNGRFERMSDHYVVADGEFADLEVVVLTNLYCGSAGDGTALYLSKLPNVTLAGISDSSGCNQEIGGACYLPEGLVVAFPSGLILNEESEPNIDIKADRISRNPNEVYIPFDKDAAMQMFSGEGDYEIEWAIEFLEK